MCDITHCYQARNDNGTLDSKLTPRIHQFRENIIILFDIFSMKMSSKIVTVIAVVAVIAFYAGMVVLKILIMQDTESKSTNDELVDKFNAGQPYLYNITVVFGEHGQVQHGRMTVIFNNGGKI